MRYKKYFRKTSLKQKGVGEFFLNQIALKKPKFFLEVGVFHGVTSRNVCELLFKIHGKNFKYIGLDLFEESSENKDEIIPELINQVVSPVEWLKTMKTINNTNIEQIIEFGPGKVLSNLCRRTLKDVDIVNIETLDDIKHQEIWND